MERVPTNEVADPDRPSVAGVARCARSVLVVNRRARSGDANLGPALDILARRLGPLDSLEVDDPDVLSDRLEAACEPEVERVVVAGGDGTVNLVLPALLAARKPLGILPLGTANDLARTLGIPDELEPAAELIVAGRTRRVDVGTVNGGYFLNAAGIGFSTNLQRELPAWAKRTFGPLAYPIGVVRRWRRHRPFTVRIRGEGIMIERRVIQLTVANGRFYGGGMTAEQDAQIDDAGLDVLLVLPRPWWAHLCSIVSLKRGVYPLDSPVVARRCSGFELTTGRPQWISTDGEPSTLTPATFGVLPGVLEVFAP